MEETQDRLDVAIVGMAGVFPGARNVREFWKLLRNGVEAVTFFTEEELIEAGVDPTLVRDPNYVKARAIIEDEDKFDAGFFDLPPREVEMMDPQHRLFLQTAWHALEDAGYDPDRYDGLIGLFGGVSMNTYLFSFLTSGRGRITSAEGYQLSIGNDKDFLTTRVSYKLNLKGPSVAVQTACSTSLVAVHLAYQSLLDYTCDMALAGGVSITIPQKQGYYYQEGMILSKDGHCRAFDHRASGTISGNGVGIVVLKRLEDALRDGDHIYAVIRGSAINNDGSDRVGYTAPSVNGQANVIASALAVADVDPETVTYVETHGTGTVLGDPIEIAALTQVYREHTDKKQYCAVGSVKTNIGHLDAAAGVAGLIKAALALEHGQIPPSLNFEKPNPKIDFENSPFFVNTELRDWDVPPGVPRRAGVSSFGIGGTNVHVVLEEAPKQASDATGRPANLLLLSAKSQGSLDRATADLAEHLKEWSGLNLHDVAYTLQVGRKHFNVRRAVVASDLNVAAQKLADLDPKTVLSSSLPKDFEAPPVAFMFSGQGSQYVNMGRRLYEIEPVFRAELDRCFELVASQTGLDLKGVVFASPGEAEEAARQLNRTEVTQPALFAIEYALARLWMHWGLSPAAMVGHSIGEYVAATLAGVFGLEDALRVVVERGRLMQQLPPGAMLSVPLGEADVQRYLTDDVALAAVNSTTNVVLSGPFEAIERVEKALTADGVQYRRLHTSHAFHSSMMDPVLSNFTEVVSGVRLNEPKLPYLSNTTGTWIRKEEATDPAYYARHLRSTVRFADNVYELLQDSRLVLLEVGPGTVLATLARRHAANSLGRTILASLPHPKDASDEYTFLLRTLARLWLAGVEVDWQRFYEGERRLRVPLPGYAFERNRYWMGTTRPVAGAVGEQGVAKRKDVGDWFYQFAWREEKAARFGETGLATSGVVLFFDDGSELGRALEERLRSDGATIFRVQAGKQFATQADGLFEIRPDEASDYQNLLRALKERDAVPRLILHLWGVGPARNADVERGYASLVFLSQALGKVLAGQTVTLAILADRVFRVLGGEPVEPTRWAAYGLSKVIRQELPHVEVRFVDVGVNGASAEAVTRVLSQAPGGELAVALRNKRRWLLEAQATPLPQAEEVPALLREKGVYVITGGLGRIGLHLAEHLAKKLGAKLALLEPYDFPAPSEWDTWTKEHDKQDSVSARILRLRGIQEAGGEVRVLRADVSRFEDVQAALKETKAAFGRVDGVFHLAGVVGTQAFRALSEIGPEDWKKQFAPKVDGALNLSSALDALELRPAFVLLQSSMASVLGGLGFGVYAAANAVLDGLAAAREDEPGTRWLAVDWDGWRFEEDEAASGLGAEVAQLAVEPAEGLEAFDRILNQPELTNVLVSTGDLSSRIEKWLRPAARDEESEAKKPVAGLHDRPDLPTPYVAPETELHKQVAEVWSRLLGISTIGIHDDFFDLGGNSLMATQLVSELRETFQVELPLRDLFDDPTISGVCKVIEKERAEQAGSEVSKVAEALKQIESLSDEEARRLLEELRSGSPK